MKASPFSFLLLLVALASCTQQDPTTGTTTVEGQVVAEASRKPLAGATVQLYHQQNGGYQTVSGATAKSYAINFEATNTTSPTQKAHQLSAGGPFAWGSCPGAANA